MKFAPIVNPDVCRPAPKPVRVDLRKIFLTVTALWVLALVISLVLLACGFNVEYNVVVCVAGTAIGVVLLIWEYFDRWDYRRLGE